MIFYNSATNLAKLVQFIPTGFIGVICGDMSLASSTTMYNTNETVKLLGVSYFHWFQ